MAKNKNIHIVLIVINSPMSSTRHVFQMSENSFQVFQLCCADYNTQSYSNLFFPLKLSSSNQLIYESDRTLLPNWSKSPQGVLQMKCLWEWGPDKCVNIKHMQHLIQNKTGNYAIGCIIQKNRKRVSSLIAVIHCFF